MRAGSAPTATQLRTASSMAEAAIQYGSKSAKRGFMPQEMTMPARRPQDRAARPRHPKGHRECAPTSGLTTLPDWTSWSYCRITHSLLQTLSEPRILQKIVVVTAISAAASSGRRGGGENNAPRG